VAHYAHQVVCQSAANHHSQLTDYVDKTICLLKLHDQLRKQMPVQHAESEAKAIVQDQMMATHNVYQSLQSRAAACT